MISYCDTEIWCDDVFAYACGQKDNVISTICMPSFTAKIL